MVIILLVIGIIALALLLGGLYAYKEAFYAKGSKRNVSGYFEKNERYQSSKDEINSLVCQLDLFNSEEVNIKAYDGAMLYARYYHIADKAPLQILVHGYKGSAKRDMCGAHKLARSQGHNILLIDQRGNGKSGGKSITFGVKERCDLLSWINYASSRFGDIPIFLVGVSMGGATVLMATDMDLPENVVGVMADCPFSSPKAIIKKVCKDRGMPECIYPFVTIGALLYGHFNPNKEEAVKSVKNSRVPILILHGKKDSFVPYEMAKEIYDSAKCEKEIHIFDDADHGMSYMTDPEKYEELVNSFVKKCLNNRPCVDKI